MRNYIDLQQLSAGKLVILVNTQVLTYELNMFAGFHHLEFSKIN